jgi:hypothetical protein
MAISHRSATAICVESSASASKKPPVRGDVLIK